MIELGKPFLKWGDAGSWTRLQQARNNSPHAPTHILMRQCYAGVTACHASRIMSIETYKSDGIRPITIREHGQRAMALAVDLGLTINQKTIDRAIETLPKPAVPARVYSMIDHRQLKLDESFCKYGAEYMEHLLRRLLEMNGVDDRCLLPFLSSCGIPTIFEFKVPWDTLDVYVANNVDLYADSVLLELDRGDDPREVDWCHSEETSIAWGRIVQAHHAPM